MKIYKKLKPFISLVCTLLIIFSMVSFSVGAVDTNSVTASTSATVKQGNSAYCYVEIASTEGLAAIDVTVHFDPAKVKILGVYNIISCTLYDSVTNTDNIQFSYILDGEGSASKTRLFYFQYQALSNADVGNSYFDITIGEAYDNSLNDVDVSGSRCNFIIAETITNKTCSVYSSSSMSTSIEQEFTISYRFSTYQISSGTAVISYDPELFEVIEVTNGAFLTNKIVDVNTELNGEIYISFLGTEYYSNTNFISVTFKTIKNVTETSKIVFKATELIDKELNSISCNGYTTNVNIAFDSTYTGDAPAMKLDGAFSYEDMQITLVVSLEKDSRLGAGDFVIAFDPELVSYNSCTKGFSPSFFNINDKNVENGELKFHIISLSDITTEETVLTVIFDVKHPYSCESADFTLSGKNLTDSLTESILLNFIDASILFEYRITFCNEDGSILKSDMYHYGDDVVAPDAPVKEKDDYYIYIFKGWDKEIVNCCTDAEYKAVFAAEHYHTYTAVVSTPTCTEKGYTTYTCACGDSYVDDYVDANGHSYTSEITTPATHLAEGVITFTCTCGDSYTEAIEKTPEHTYEAVVTAPTCTEKGYTTYTCACGDTYVDDYVDANGHSYTNYLSDNNATCTADGTKTAKCDRCEVTDTIADAGSAKGHSPAEAVKENEVAATCTTDGSYDSVVYCSECNTELSREAKTTEKLGHSFTNYISDNNATCTADGTKTAKCDRCEVTDTIADIGSAKGHTEEIIPAVEATCTSTGLTEGKKCSVCGEILVAQTVTNALGHSFTNYVSNNDATCTADGTKTAKCDRCDATDTITDVGSAKGHSPAEAVKENEVAATCTTDGSYDSVVYCSVCNKELSRETKTIEKLGHNWGEWTVETPASCTAKGTENRVCANDASHVETRDIGTIAHTEATKEENKVKATCTTDGSYDSVVYCSVCNKELSRETKTIEKLGHNWGEWTVETVASCTEKGTEKRVCANDESHVETRDIATIAHTEATKEENKVEATCTTDGSYDSVVYCSVCNKELSRETKTIEKLGHSFTNYVSNGDATCTADGTKTAKCDRCEVTDTITDVGSAKGHTEKTVNATAASCTESGYTGDVVCSVCNEVISKGTVIAKLDHKKVVDKAVAATCTKTGLTEGSHCSVCGTVIKKQTTVAKKAHSYKNVITKADATKKKSGKATPTCSVCGAKGKETTIAYPKTATLKFTSATYTGKAQKPSVTVKDSKGKTISSKYYTVSYKDNKNVGKATVTITFKGNYTGKITKTFTINPKGTSISNLSAKSKGFTATWKKQTTQTTGYEIQYSNSSKFTSKTTKTIKVTSAKTVSKTVSKLKANSKYYVRVRTYKTVSKTNYYSAWSKALSVTTKK